MGETTITTDEDAKNRLVELPADNWSERLNGIARILPSREDIFDEGCQVCDRTPPSDASIGDVCGAFHHISHTVEDNEFHDTHYFCSLECAAEFQKGIDDAFPTNPDLVLVGGKDCPRVKVTNAEFLIDGSAMEVTVGLPGAFSTCEFVGEPVYVVNKGEIRHSGLVERIFHEETTTTLALEHDYEVVDVYRPTAEAWL